MELVAIACLIVAMAVTWLTTPATIRLARFLGAVDSPGERKVHRLPVPRIGGLAVFFGFGAGLAFAAYLTGTTTVSTYWSGLAIAATGMLVVGLIDDLWGLSYQWKFLAQILAAVLAWYCGFRIELISAPWGGELLLGVFSLPATVLWIVGTTNAVNLIDGLDGLATGIALITTGAVGVIAGVRGELGVTAASVALAGSLIGFLRFNFNPARIFLGDSGSMFLGFVLAVTAVRGSQKGPTAVAILVPLLLLGLPLMDTGTAMIRRLYRLGYHGSSSPARLRYVVRNFGHVFHPDRQHIHHRLMELGLSHRSTVVVLYGVGSLFALSAFLFVLLKSTLVAALLMLLLGGLMAGFLLFVYVRSLRDEVASRPSDRGEGGEPIGVSPAPRTHR